MITTITSKGQATIPSPIRKILNIKKGDKILFRLNQLSQSAILEKVTSGASVANLFGSLKSAQPYTSLDTLREKSAKLLGRKYTHRKTK